MRPRVNTLVFGVLNLSARCPYCRSHFVRLSREAYEGGAARVLRLVAYRCRDCKRHFAVPPYARTGPPAEETAFVCPACGGRKTVDSAAGPGGFGDRFLGRRPQRCLSCRERFVAIDRQQVVANLLLLIAALAAIALASSLIRDKAPWTHPGPKPPAAAPHR